MQCRVGLSASARRLRRLTLQENDKVNTLIYTKSKRTFSHFSSSLSFYFSFLLLVSKNSLSLQRIQAETGRVSDLIEAQCNYQMRRKLIVKTISQAIHRVAPTAEAILYGSEARGDARSDSDIDILILLDGEQRNLKREDELAGVLYDIELATGVSISPMIMPRKQWENRPFKTPFYVNVMNEGIRI